MTVPNLLRMRPSFGFYRNGFRIANPGGAPELLRFSARMQRNQSGTILVGPGRLRPPGRGAGGQRSPMWSAGERGCLEWFRLQTIAASRHWQASSPRDRSLRIWWGPLRPQKPPRRPLGARPGAWEQVGNLLRTGTSPACRHHSVRRHL